MILRRVGILSLGKFMGFLYGLLGLLIGAVVSLIALLGMAGQNEGRTGLFISLGVASIIVFPLLYGFFGFLGGIITGALFNLVASLAGGIEIELSHGDKIPIRSSPEPLSGDPFRG